MTQATPPCVTTGQPTALPTGLENIRYLRYCLDIARPNVNLVGGGLEWPGREWFGVGAVTWRCATTPSTLTCSPHCPRGLCGEPSTRPPPSIGNHRSSLY